MACTITLFDYLGGPKDTGGDWTFDPGATGTSPVRADFNGIDTTYSAGNPITGSDDTLTFAPNASTAAGTYVFQYAAGETCTTPATVTITVVNGVYAGVSVEMSWCTVDPNPPYNMLAQIVGATLPNPMSLTGRWTSDDYGVAGHNDGGSTTDATDDTFDPNLAAAGTYIFTYTVDGDTTDGLTYGEDDCDSCVSTSTLTINILDTYASGVTLPGPFTVCKDY